MDDEEAGLQKDWAEEDNVVEETVLKTTAEDNTAGVKVENVVKLMRSGVGALLDESAATMSVLPEKSLINTLSPRATVCSQINSHSSEPNTGVVKRTTPRPSATGTLIT